jgi:ribosomal protein S18 acetylase RimI-like enzyme
LYSVCAVEDDKVIGFARLVGDGGLYFYLQDVIVLPAHQRKGVGSALVERLLAFLGSTALPGAFIGLMAAKGASDFYRRYGFAERPEGRPGMFRLWAEADTEAIGLEAAALRRSRRSEPSG